MGAVAEVARAVVGAGRGRVLFQDSCPLLYCCSEVCLPLLFHWGSHRSKATDYCCCCEQESKNSSLTHGCTSSDLGVPLVVFSSVLGLVVLVDVSI